MWFNFDGLFGFLVMMGLILGLLFCVPAYYIGRHNGRQAAYEEAEQHQVLDIRYDQKTGVKEYIWKTNF